MSVKIYKRMQIRGDWTQFLSQPLDEFDKVMIISFSGYN